LLLIIFGVGVLAGGVSTTLMHYLRLSALEH
jgi:hypothetical protein